MVDDMEIEDETPSISRTIQTTEFNFLDEPYHVPVPILNMFPQQKKRNEDTSDINKRFVFHIFASNE